MNSLVKTSSATNMIAKIETEFNKILFGGSIRPFANSEEVKQFCTKKAIPQKDLDEIENHFIQKFHKYNKYKCPLGGDRSRDCAGCVYSIDYHFVNGECVRREES